MRFWPPKLRLVIGSLVVACILVVVARQFYPWTHHDPSLDRTIPEYTRPALGAGTQALRVIAFGDSGTAGRGQRRVAEAMLAKAQVDGLDLVLMLGDNFYPNGVASVDDPQWESKIVKPYERLNAPIYPCLGNHDHKGNPDAQVERSKLDPKWRMGGRQYTFERVLADGTRIQFFALDTDPISKGVEVVTPQLEWLDAQLRASTAHWKVAFGHHPIHSRGRGDNKRMRRDIEPILVKHDVDMYLCGHDHSLQVLKPRNGVNYIISGGGGGTDNPHKVDWTEDTLFAATLGGFVWLRFTRNDVVVEIVRTDHQTQFGTVFAKS
ncbi:MAG: metallophosphoesterase [Planctomycetes bacterium]|nr:metallophosphoesterase [Planctomycetota bacterium]